MDFERGRANVQAQFSTQKIGEPFHEMPGRAVALVDQWAMTVEHLDPGIFLIQRRNVRVVLPQVGTRHAHIGEELIWISQMQIPHGVGGFVGLFQYCSGIRIRHER